MMAKFVLRKTVRRPSEGFAWSTLASLANNNNSVEIVQVDSETKVIEIRLWKNERSDTDSSGNPSNSPQAKENRVYECR